MRFQTRHSGARLQAANPESIAAAFVDMDFRARRFAPSRNDGETRGTALTSSASASI
jgi:hypothetical protein